MKIQINTGRNIDGHEATSRHAESVVETALSHLAEHITRVEVHLSDANGEKGGSKDKRCLMEARLEGLQLIAVTDEAETTHRALAGAAEKLKQAVGHILDRRNQRWHLGAGEKPPAESTSDIGPAPKLGKQV